MSDILISYPKPSPEELFHDDAKVTVQEALHIIERNLLEGEIKGVIRWGNNWIFCVYTNDSEEGELDPFYSVDVNTGAFSGFSIVGDQDTAGIIEAFHAEAEHSESSDEPLYHYGVKGMKWGVRRTPEQLGRSNSKKKSGPSKASVTAEATSNAIKPLAGFFIPRASVTNTLMRAGQLAQTADIPMKVALKSSAFGPQAAIGYAITGLDSGAYRVPVVATKNALRGGWNKDKSLSQKNMSQADIQKKVIAPINKDYPGLGTTNNCLRCTYAYEMRRRGYDVAATKTALASGQTALGPKLMTKSLKTSTKIKRSDKPTGIKGVFANRKPSEAEIFRVMSQQPDRSRGDFQMNWGFGGHSIAYEIINSRPVFFDTQSGKTYSTPAQLKSLTGPARGIKFNRLDNKNLNNTAITAWLKDRK